MASSVKTHAVIGKPSRYYAQKALDIIGRPRERCLMVGDRLETDILLGLESGIKTAWY
nr:HAD hydrolase-like protein [Desulforamulus aquiferis]